ncbi:MAG: trypsin-like peptidase domain-containing protein [Clostridiales bacterium]|nr:trypsin-like peptidase domain-containing protein [Clostridiales bacterium]
MKSKSMKEIKDEIMSSRCHLSFEEKNFQVGLLEPHFFQTSVFPIIHDNEKSLDLLGTAFCISSNGFLLTAKHVLKDLTDKKEREGVVKNGVIDFTELNLYVLYCTNIVLVEGQYFGGLLPITNITYSNESDIALLTIDIPTIDDVRVPLMQFTLSPGIPKLYQQTMAIGYSKKLVTFNGDLSRFQRTINNSLNASKGEIVEIYGNKRDSILLKFPCFRTNARYDHGMSGGPIISVNGGVIGIITMSLSTEDSQEPYYSHGVLLPPLLVMKAKYRESADSKIKEDYIYDMAQAGYFSIDDSLKQIRVTRNRDNRIIGISYSVPKANEIL